LRFVGVDALPHRRDFPMNVRELIEILEKFPQDSLVCCASDEEGNSIGAIYGPLFHKAQKDGRFFDIIDDEYVDDYEDEDLIDIVVIWP
jgi:hypothetical protein